MTLVVLLSAAGISHEVHASPENPENEEMTPAPVTGSETTPEHESSAVQAVPAITPSTQPAPATSITVRELETPLMSLGKQLIVLSAQSGGKVGIAIRELGGGNPLSWSYNGSQEFSAASTYKLAALMAEADGIATGSLNPTGQICYENQDWEDGWFTDYQAGNCYSRTDLASRAGLESDNTAGHMLVRDFGGADALNAFVAAHGATASGFYVPNQTTADDLASLWVGEARGQMGGPAAQQWLYPELTHTAYEAGIPAGVPAGTMVVHKIGDIDETENDAALVMGPHGAYVLVVCTDGVGGDAGWSLIAQISSRVWQYETSRTG